MKHPQIPDPVFHVALFEPEIPPNTGNIGRLCAATCCPLHLVGRLGFRIDEHAVRRAGLDYWHLIRVAQHQTLPEAEQAIAADGRAHRTWLFSGKAQQSYLDVPFQRGDVLVFGKESTGLEASLLEARSQAMGVNSLEELLVEAEKLSLVTLGLIDKPSATILGVNGKLDDQAPVNDIYLLMEHGSPKEARIFPKGGHMGRTPGMDASVILDVITTWLKQRLSA